MRGEPGANARARIGAGGNKALTPEEQVDALLDQATDASILGRTWGGWRSYL